jgi:hypothetical protein
MQSRIRGPRPHDLGTAIEHVFDTSALETDPLASLNSVLRAGMQAKFTEWALQNDILCPIDCARTKARSCDAILTVAHPGDDKVTATLSVGMVHLQDNTSRFHPRREYHQTWSAVNTSDDDDLVVTSVPRDQSQRRFELRSTTPEKIYASEEDSIPEAIKSVCAKAMESSPVLRSLKASAVRSIQKDLFEQVRRDPTCRSECSHAGDPKYSVSLEMSANDSMTTAMLNIVPIHSADNQVHDKPVRHRAKSFTSSCSNTELEQREITGDDSVRGESQQARSTVSAGPAQPRLVSSIGQAEGSATSDRVYRPRRLCYDGSVNAAEIAIRNAVKAYEISDGDGSAEAKDTADAMRTAQWAAATDEELSRVALQSGAGTYDENTTFGYEVTRFERQDAMDPEDTSSVNDPLILFGLQGTAFVKVKNTVGEGSHTQYPIMLEPVLTEYSIKPDLN